MFYLDLFRALQRERVDYLLIGGLALNIHGVERATMDIDLMLALDDDNLVRFLKAAESLSLQPQIPVPMQHLAQAEKRREWIEQKHLVAFALRSPQPYAPTVDLLLQTPLDFRAAHARRVEKEIGGLHVSLASVDDLIALKSAAGRAQDQSDIAALQRLQALGKSQ